MHPPSPAPNREIELKLHLAREDIPRLWRHPRIRELTLQRLSTRALESVYYDTAELDLARRGLVLRLRRAGRRTIQTVKTRTGAAAGLFERGEWESPIPGESPDLTRIGDAAVRAQIEASVQGKELTPMVRTLVRGSRRRIGSPGAGADWEALLDLDVGESKTSRGSVPICELELELVRGDPSRLYELALELHESIPLRPGAVSKAELGLIALLGGSLPQRARQPKLPVEATLEDALSATLLSCLEQITANEAAARLGADPEGVHQMRVGVRRLRSALALFRGVLPGEQLEHFRRELRWLGDELGDARDLDVLLEETLQSVASHAFDSSVLGQLPETAEQMRREARARVRADLDSRRYGGLLLELGAWSAGRSWRAQPLAPESARLFAPAREVGRELLGQRYRKVRWHGRQVGRLSIAEAHRLRIEVKKLRYACEFLGSLYPHQGARRFGRRLSRLQDTLGHLNDQTTAERLLERILARIDPDAAAAQQRAAGFVAGWTSRVAAEKLRPLEKRWKRFSKLSPFWHDGG